MMAAPLTKVDLPPLCWKCCHGLRVHDKGPCTECDCARYWRHSEDDGRRAA